MSSCEAYVADARTPRFSARIRASSRTTGAGLGPVRTLVVMAPAPTPSPDALAGAVASMCDSICTPDRHPRDPVLRAHRVSDHALARAAGIRLEPTQWVVGNRWRAYLRVDDLVTVVRIGITHDGHSSCQVDSVCREQSGALSPLPAADRKVAIARLCERLEGVAADVRGRRAEAAARRDRMSACAPLFASRVRSADSSG